MMPCKQVSHGIVWLLDACTIGIVQRSKIYFPSCDHVFPQKSHLQYRTDERVQ